MIENIYILNKLLLNKLLLNKLNIMSLLQIDNLIEGVVVKRPSKLIKSPYVADVILLESNKKNHHTKIFQNRMSYSFSLKHHQ